MPNSNSAESVERRGLAKGKAEQTPMTATQGAGQVESGLSRLQWLMQFTSHRVSDKRVLELLVRTLRAGVEEGGRRTKTTVGTSQGAVISPLLGNIYLHYVLDLWVKQWRKKFARGELYIVRFADDFVVGFQYKDDGDKFKQALQERLQQFNLTLHPEKTRLIEFGRFAKANRNARGQTKPETFDF